MRLPINTGVDTIGARGDALQNKYDNNFEYIGNSYERNIIKYPG